MRDGLVYYTNWYNIRGKYRILYGHRLADGSKGKRYNIPIIDGKLEKFGILYGNKHAPTTDGKGGIIYGRKLA